MMLACHLLLNWTQGLAEHSGALRAGCPGRDRGDRRGQRGGPFESLSKAISSEGGDWTWPRRRRRRRRARRRRLRRRRSNDVGWAWHVHGGLVGEVRRPIPDC